VLKSTAYNIQMSDIRTVDPAKYNSALAEALKKDKLVVQPDWVLLVKTGTSRQRPTAETDFWYKRAASILRQIYIRKIVGTQRLRTRYGGRKDRGMQPPAFFKSGGKIIRSILQQLDASGLTEKVKGKHSGRQLTAKGKEFMESLT
jgi:small subunit ribosomal protein S19e